MTSRYLAPGLGWYTEHARDLPWRDPAASAWSVMVSEIMLQQTPVSRVLPAHREWLRRWPTPAALAADPPGEAVRQWGRLGYPRRALRLHEAAPIVTERHGGVIPDSYDELLALPGVGRYTAAAIASFAYRQRHPVLDTNVRRVLSRLITGAEFPGKTTSAAEWRLAEKRLSVGPAGAAPGGGGGDGARRAGVHGGPAPVRGVPGVGRLHLAGGGPPGRGGPAGGPALRGHRPAVPGAPAGRAARRRRPRPRQSPGRRGAHSRPARPRPRRPGRRRPRRRPPRWELRPAVLARGD